MVSAGAYGRKAAAFRPSPCWVTAGLRLGLDDEDQAAVERDGVIMETWCNTVGDDDLVWILGGVGDPEYLDGLPGRKYVLGGPGEGFSALHLAPDLTPRRLARTDGDEDKGKQLGMAALYPIERERAALVELFTEAAGGLAWVWTGWGAHYDRHKSVVHPRVLDGIVVRGRMLAPVGTVDGRSAHFDIDTPQLHRLEDV